MGRQKTMMPNTSQVRRCRMSLIAIAVCATASTAGTTLAAAEPVQFEKHVRPILKTHCFLCHGEAGVTKGKLDLRLRRWLVRGGESGAAIAPGKPSDSYLLN